MKYGPSRGELIFRLVFSLAGLGLLLVALMTQEIDGLAWLEVGLFAGLFLGGSAVWSAWKLIKGDGR
jgi:hypothetical protein